MSKSNICCNHSESHDNKSTRDDKSTQDDKSTRDDKCITYDSNLKLINEYDVICEKSILLGLTGKIGCGKTTVESIFQRKFNFSTYSFAFPLKEIAKILGFKQEEVFGTQEQKLAINKFWGISGRKFLQKFGSEVCRDYLPKVLPSMNFNNKTLWIRLFEKFYADEKNRNVVVSDVRFEDEAKCIKDLKGYIIRIEREDNRGLLSDDKHKSHNHHKSELEMSSIKPHFVIRNNGSVEDLEKKVYEVTKLILDGYGNIPNVTIYL
jgi:hypothetical protein